MNIANTLLGIIALIIVIAFAIISEGLLLPILLPIGFWGLQKMGIAT